MKREVKYSDPNMYHEGVLAYREQFHLVPNKGYRRDIAVTIKTYDDLLIWQDLLAHWGYTDKITGKWKARNPLDIKGLLTCFEFKQREHEIREQRTLQERSRERIQPRRVSPLPQLRRGANGWKG